MNKTNIRFSVIIPTYNHAQFIRKCLQSLINQTYSNWEAIVVNNYSQDNTVEIINSFKDNRIRLVNFRNNGIIASSRNQGIGYATGEFIAFLDSDDWWYPQKLEIIEKNITKADVFYHKLDIYTSNGKTTKKTRCRKLKSPVFIDLMKNANAMTNSSVVVRKSIIVNAGGLCEDRDIVGVEDFDLWLRISRITEKFFRIPQSLGGYWIGAGNTSEVSDRQIDRLKAVHAHNIKYLSKEDQRQAEAILCYQIGRIKHKIGLIKEAKKYYKVSLRTHNLFYKLASIIFYFFTLVSFERKK